MLGISPTKRLRKVYRQVSLSEDLLEFAKAVKLVSQVDDVRIDKINELKDK